MSYSQQTLDSLTSEIASLMGDASNVYWSADEIQRAIKEALLFWGALSLYWRDRGTFSTVSGTAFYDLSTQLSTLRTRNYTLGNLTNEIQYHLLEPANGTAGTSMTAQFTISEITGSLVRNRNKLLIDTRIPLTYTASGLNTVPTPDGRTDLTQTVALVERACWYDSTSQIYYRLYREDAWSADYFDSDWNTNPGVPVAYSMAETAPLGMQLIPPPAASGNLALIYGLTNTMAVADGTSFAYPDEYVHAIKYMTLYEILSTYDPGFDPVRAKYCLERYKQIVDLASAQASVIRVLVNGSFVPLDTIYALDSLSPRWQNRSAKPTVGATAFDLLALSYVPDAVYSVQCDLVRSAPLPASGTSYIQVGKEEMQYIIDYTRHILSFKMGGAEFLATMPLYDNFLKGAAQRNKLLATRARYMTPLFDAAERESHVSPAA